RNGTVYRTRPNPDANTIITGLKSRDFTMSGIGPDTYDLLKDDPTTRTVLKPGKNNMYVEFNVRKPLFDDVRVRKALSYAVDRKALSDAIWKGRADIYNSVFPYDWWPTKQNTTLFDNDVEQAKRLLDEAGGEDGGDGRRQKDGPKFRV